MSPSNPSSENSPEDQLGTPKGDEDLRPALEAPRFSLRMLLATVTLVAITLAAARVIHPLLSATLLLFGLAIFAHVAGNALGTRLLRKGSRTDPSPRKRESVAAAVTFAPVTRLSHRHRLGRTMKLLTGLGALLGGIGGGGLLAIFNWSKITIASGLLAIVSCGVLGGLLGFWISSLTQIAYDAWRHAHDNADPQPHYHRRR